MAADEQRDTPETFIDDIKATNDREHGRGRLERQELAHAMLWEAHERGTRVKAWMLRQDRN